MNGATTWGFTVPAIPSGVYLIRREGRALYVGQSTCVLGRLKGHSILQPGDTVEIEATAIDDLDEREREWIERYRPEFNRAGLTWPYIPAWKRRREFKYHRITYTSAANMLRAVAGDYDGYVGESHLIRAGVLPSGIPAEDLPHTAIGAPDYANTRGHLRWQLDRALAALGSTA